MNLPPHETASADTARRGPLAGLRILDLSRVLAGPFCSMILGDLGAEVIKIEEVEEGDLTRTVPPMRNGESHYFLAVNRNKRSVAIDARAPAGRDAILAMVAKCDVVLENFRPGVMDRLELGYAALKEANPAVILCSISGFGADGSMRDCPSFDLVTQALSGVMSINGEPQSPPTKLALPMGDLAGGLWAAIAILAAVNDRRDTRKGAHIDLSLLEGLMGLLGYIAQLCTFTGTNPERMGNRHHSIVPYGMVPTRDGHIILALHVGSFWERFCTVVSRPELSANPRFADMESRRTNRDELEAILVEIMQARSTAEWQALLQAEGIPSSPVLDIVEALEQTPLRERNFVRDLDHPVAGPIRTLISPVRFADRYADLPLAAPQVLGADTRAVLGELSGLDANAIEALITSGIAGSLVQHL